eukprot:comp21767_c0_seq1/m.30869 comp21767_c0_seq1/g.30869  ORF comp21767_c0_seq1/g.30869 comp21767_c0_seq1/m.30869 type:complete len:436 (-) comp21767_c0_seq1:361-1668(-)
MPSNMTPNALTTAEGAAQITKDFVRAIPKTDLHMHLDGSVRLDTLIELAQKEGVSLPAYTVEGLRQTVFKDNYVDLVDYLQGFAYVGAVLQNAENLTRVSYELAQDCFSENVRYFEVRFAPQLHCNDNLDIPAVLRAVNAGLMKAKEEYNASPAIVNGEEPPFEYGIICTAMRMFNEHFSAYYKDLKRCHQFAPDKNLQSMASVELARAAVYMRDHENLPIVGFDLAGSENGFPADTHDEAFEYIGRHFMCRTVHAGEAYGPESVYQAISSCGAERIGHGYHLFNWELVKPKKGDVEPRKFVKDLAGYIAQQRITIEVCLTSNTNTMPELRDKPLSHHAFGHMLKEELSVSICTDNRTVSNTTATEEFTKAVTEFKLTAAQLRDLALNGFRASFWPINDFKLKKAYLTKMDAYYRKIEAQFGISDSSVAAPKTVA